MNGKRNGKGKEYGVLKRKLFVDMNEMCIIFEGIYLNGKRWNGNGYINNHNKIYKLINGNGLVIEYNNDKIIFEGNYLYGEKHGKVKEYDNKGKIKFEGNYSNGLKYGKGKTYIDGDLRFDGEYLDGKLYGKIKNIMNVN